MWFNAYTVPACLIVFDLHTMVSALVIFTYINGIYLKYANQMGFAQWKYTILYAEVWKCAFVIGSTTKRKVVSGNMVS